MKKIKKGGTCKYGNKKGQFADFIEVLSAKTGTPPELQVSTDTLNCIISSFIAKASSNVNFPTWIWRDSSGNVLGNSDTLTIRKPGTYSIQVTDMAGCSNLQIIKVVEDKSPPIISAFVTTITCREDSSVLSFVSPDSILAYLWSGPSTVFNFGSIHFVKLPGLYKLEASGRNGCIAEEFVQVNSVKNVPDFKYSVDTLSCKDTLVRIVPIINSPLELIEFSGPDSFLTNEFAPWVSKSGLYKVKIIDTAGCRLDTLLIVPEDLETPDFRLSGEELNCGEDSVQILLFHNNNPLFKYQYSWDGPVGFISDQQNPWVRQNGLSRVKVSCTNGYFSKNTYKIF